MQARVVLPRFRIAVEGRERCRLRPRKKLLAYAIAIAGNGLKFQAPLSDWKILVEELTGRPAFEPHRSHVARMQILAMPGLASGTSFYFHVIGVRKRCSEAHCRATVQAEAYARQAGMEQDTSFKLPSPTSVASLIFQMGGLCHGLALAHRLSFC